MKFVFASDSFKGTLSSARIGQLLTIVANETFPGCTIASIPIADGGEGTVDAVINALNGWHRSVRVHNALMEEIPASYGVYPMSHEGVLPVNGAIIEMSAASGITLIPGDHLNPLNTTTFGTGELIRDALDQGCRRITIAIGGSATNDGGIGALRALGARFLDKDGNELGVSGSDGVHAGGTGADLAWIDTIDITGLHPAIKDTEITVLCDVDNPLTGPDGATFTFGRQKCSPDMDPDELNETLSSLEAGMNNYARVLSKTFNIDVNSVPGVGAAGGLGASLCYVLGASLSSGIDTILQLINFDSYLNGADLCITGEGRLDWQSTHGKTISGIARHCTSHKVPLVAIVGSVGEGFEGAYEIGINHIVKTSEGVSLEKAMMNAEEYYLRAARAFFATLRP